MFEELVSSLLSRYLGKWIKDLNSEQLSLGIWEGNVELRQLEIKGDALNGLNLPICVKRGVVGCIHFELPWKNLSSKPVKVVLEDLYILCGPETNIVYDEKAELDSQLASKPH